MSEIKNDDNFLDEEFALPPVDFEDDSDMKIVDASPVSQHKSDSSKLRSIMEDEAPKKETSKFDRLFKSKYTRGKKTKKKKKETDEERFFLADDDLFEENEYDEEITEEENENISVTENPEQEKTQAFELDEKTKVINIGEYSEIEEYEDVYSVTLPLEPKESEPVEAKDIYISKIKEDSIDGQMMLSGFDAQNEDIPDNISEEEAEQKLFEKRKEKIRQFVIFQDDEEDTDSDTNKIGDLFDKRDERPRMKESDEFIGIEYSQIKDSRRITKYLISQKKKSFNRLLALGAMTLVTIIVSIASSISTTVGGDRFLTIVTNLLLICGAIAVSIQSIINSFSLLKKKKLSLNTAVSFSAVLCVVQNLLMLVLYFLDKNTVSVFSGAGVVALFITELNNFIVNNRTLDAMKLCTGTNKDKLYSIESVNDDKDIMELLKNVRVSGSRIRYSSKIQFPSHLVELCMSNTSADKSTKLFIPVALFFSVINLIIAWIVKSDFPTGFAAFVTTFTLCSPVYGSLLYQLPMRWFNKLFNKTGGMISCQEAVEELCKTNVIMLDSKDLFDRKACAMHGFKDFRNVRLDDAMLYAAAMEIRADGPLADVFDQMIINRRDMLPQVKSFNYEEKLGISGWINGQKVVMGNHAMMLAHNIQMPESIDEDKYLLSGHEVIYLAIAHKLAAMMVVDYKPNKKIAPYLKKMRDSGVTILVNNSDHNVTETMISSCFNMRLDNIKIINNTSGRVFKRYSTRPKLASKAYAIHDGTAYSFMKSLYTASILRRLFKTSSLLMLIGSLMGFVIMLILSIINVVCDLPAVFVIFIQLFIAVGTTGIIKLFCTR
ncbi:MAG: hypothetical protein KBT46_07295 [Ruminococcus sp.]|nr:hypothetical protein [Candidatus Copronaster equi]